MSGQDRAGSPRRVLLLAPLAWPIRNLVQEGLAEALGDDLTLSVATSSTLLDELGRRFPTVEFLPMDDYSLSAESARIRGAINVLHFRLIGQDMWRRNHLAGRPRHEQLRFWAKHGRRMVRPTRAELEKLERKELAVLTPTDEGHRHDALLSTVSALVSAYPFDYLEWPYLRAARRLGVPTIYPVASWDNLLTKRRGPIRFDRYLLWSEAMRHDLELYDPSIPVEDVRVVGVPSMDHHLTGDRPSREEFFARYGLADGRPTVLWGAVPDRVMRGEHAEIEHLATQIDAGRLPRAQILVRLHPKSDPAPYLAVAERFQHVAVQASSRTAQGDIMNWLPDLEDQRNMRGALAYSDVCVNYMSTLTLDSLFYDLPVVNPRYDTSIQRLVAPRAEMMFTSYRHYRPVIDSGAVAMPRDRSALVEVIGSCLADRSLRRRERQELLVSLCGPADGRAIERLAENVREVALTPRPERRHVG